MKVQRRSCSLGSVLALSWLLLPRMAAAGVPNGAEATVPTLGGVGLGVMAGVLAMAGAWVVSRKRDR
jgi:hypothetical protein